MAGISELDFIYPNQYGGKTFLGKATVPSPVDPLDVVNKSYVDSNGGRPQNNIIYLSSAGSAPGITPDGLTLSTAFATLDDAIIAANATHPTVSSQVVIYCIDAASFNITDDRSLSEFVHLYAPYSDVVSTTNKTLTIGPICNVTIRKCTVDVTITGVPSVPPNPRASFTCQYINKGIIVSGDVPAYLILGRAVGAGVTISGTADVDIYGTDISTVETQDSTTARVYAYNLSSLTVGNGSGCSFVGNYVNDVTLAKGGLLYMNGNIQGTITEDMSGAGRIVFINPYNEQSGIPGFVGPFTSTVYHSGGMCRIGSKIVANIPTFGGAQSTATTITLETALPTVYTPGFGASFTGKAMCVDNGVWGLCDWSLLDSGQLTIDKNGGNFSGAGDLYIGPICFSMTLY